MQAKIYTNKSITILKNFITRTITGIVFVAVLIAGLCYSQAFVIAFGLVTGLTLWEFYGLVGNNEQTRIRRVAGTLGGVYLFAASFVYANGIVGGVIFLPYLLYIMYALIGELYYKASNPINNWAMMLMGQIYCAGSFSLLNFIAVDGAGFSSLLALSIFVFIWLNDTGAYLVGSQIGKRRLFERISPKKSWEGFYGGLVVSMLASQAFAWYYPAVEWYKWLGLSAVIVVFGTWGDLVESLLKRTLNVKDSGNVLPGHGGMLDRFDSVMMAIPAAYIYIELFIRN